MPKDQPHSSDSARPGQGGLRVHGSSGLDNPSSSAKKTANQTGAPSPQASRPQTGEESLEPLERRAGALISSTRPCRSTLDTEPEPLAGEQTLSCPRFPPKLNFLNSLETFRDVTIW